MKYILSVILLILCASSAQMVLAVEPTPVAPKIDYTLPYPGLLPDHPLYFMKRMRDFILEILIMEPVRKSEFYILQGNKRLEMGSMLIEQKKFSLAETTISKAEKYMEKAVTGLAVYKTNGGTVPLYVVEHAQKALAKHAEVLQELLAQVPEAQKSGIALSIDLVTQAQQATIALQ